METILPEEAPAIFPGSGTEGGKRRISLSLLLIALFLASGLTLSFLYLNYKKTLQRYTPAGFYQNQAASTASALPLSPFSFGRAHFDKLAPTASDLYLEGNNPKLFLKLLLKEKALVALEERSSLNLEEITSFFESDFAYLKVASASAFLTVGKDPDFIKERIKKLADENIKAAMIDDYLIVADSKELLKEILESYQGILPSLSLTAKYLETAKALPKIGQLLVYSSDRNYLISALDIFFGEKITQSLKEIHGNSLVITVENGGTVLKGTSYE